MSAAGRAGAGFTLIEMLVVMAITGLIAGIAFPSLERMLRRQDFETTAQTLDFALHQARDRAILRSVPVRFAPPAVPADVRLELPARGIVFFADGTSSGGSATLRGAGRVRRVAVDPHTGLAALVR